jgi:hypothetical protein
MGNKSNLPETKMVIPRHLQSVQLKQKKVVELKKENKSASINSEPFKKIERERITEFLRLLDIEDK